LETIADALTRSPASVPPTANGNGCNGTSAQPSPSERNDSDPARRVEHLHQLRAEIDVQLRKLQQP